MEGDLSVSGLLRIENSGCLSGNILYNQISVAAGGQLSGEVKQSEKTLSESEVINNKED